MHRGCEHSMRHFHGKHVRSRDPPPPPGVVLLALYCIEFQVRCNERDGGEEAGSKLHSLQWLLWFGI